jgi:hypothetical protein
VNFTELVTELSDVYDAILPVNGRIGGLSLPVCKVESRQGYIRLWLGYKNTGLDPKLNSRQLLKSMRDCYGAEPMFTVVLHTDTYQADYSAVSNFYEIDNLEYESGNLVLIAGEELLGSRKHYPPDPYLLRMQQEEPDNIFWFPYRRGVDPAVGDVAST